MSLAASALRECAQLDRQIRQEAQQRTIFDPQLRQLRSTLRNQCAAALLADYRLSVKHDVEQLLWKAVFYRPIEEFRRRIKAAEGELREKTKLAFHAFLEDGKAFYLQLALWLQQRYGPAGFSPAVAAQHLQQMGLGEPEPAEPAPRQQDCSPSVHRCLVCVGDLCRYQVNVQPAAGRDWSECRHFYWLAAQVYPAGGACYNQLAVLSSYENDDLGATFFYFRALAAASPFPVARENLVTHFEHNKAACQRLPGGGGGAAGGGGQPRGMRPSSQALRELRTRFARVLGMLCTRDDLDACPAQLAAAMADLDDHLTRVRQQSRKASLAAAAEQQPPVLVQLAACAVYVASASGAAAGGAGPQQQQQSFAAAAQQQVVAGLALELVFSITARLAAAAAAAAGKAQHGLLATASGIALLPPLHVLLKWLSSAGPPVLLPPPAQQPQEGAGLAAARKQLWQAAAELVGALQREQQQQQRQAAGAAAAEEGAAEGVVLPEDEQLAGFKPLAESAGRHAAPAGATSAANSAATSAATSADGYGDPLAAQARLARMLADAAAIAGVLASGVGGVARQPALREAMHAFVRVAAAPGQLAAAQAGAEAGQDGQQQQQQQQAVQAEPRAAAAAGPAAVSVLPASAGGQAADEAGGDDSKGMEGAGMEEDTGMADAGMEEEEEEEEEVIVYAPQARPTPSPPAAAKAAAAAAAAAATVGAGVAGQGGARPAVPAAAVDELAGGPADVAMEEEDAFVEQTAQAVAGSVLPEDDRQAPLPAVAQPASLPAPLPAALPASTLPLPVLLPSGGFPLPVPLHQAPAMPKQPAGLGAPAPAQAGAVQMPAAFTSLLGSPAGGFQQQQQAAGVPAAPGFGRQQPAQQQAAGLRSLLYGGGSGLGSGSIGGIGLGGLLSAPAASLPGHQQQQQQQQQQGQPQPFAAPAAALAAAPASPSAAGTGLAGALLSGGSAQDRWSWLGAFGPVGGASAGTGGAQPAVRTAAGAEEGGQAGQQQAGAGGEVNGMPRTANPFVP